MLSNPPKKDSESYNGGQASSLISAACEQGSESKSEVVPSVAGASVKCFFCGLSRHPRGKCPAREAVCHKCKKQGHYAKVCRSTSVSASVAPADHATLASVTAAATPSALSKAVVEVSINGTRTDGLIDSGSSESFIHPDLVERHSLRVHESHSTVTMAKTSLSIVKLILK